MTSPIKNPHPNLFFIANKKTRQVFWGFEWFCSTIKWQVTELQRLGQHGRIIPFEAKVGWFQMCGVKKIKVSNIFVNSWLSIKSVGYQRGYHSELRLSWNLQTQQTPPPRPTNSCSQSAKLLITSNDATDSHEHMKCGWSHHIHVNQVHICHQ